MSAYENDRICDFPCSTCEPEVEDCEVCGGYIWTDDPESVAKHTHEEEKKD